MWKCKTKKLQCFLSVLVLAGTLGLGSQAAYAGFTTISAGSWGQDLTDKVDLASLANDYTYNNSSVQAVNVYIISSGIRTTHGQFNGAASWGINYADQSNTDNYGGGTHLASLVASKNYGTYVIPGSPVINLVAVKVLGSTGTGSINNVINGINWAKNNAISAGKPAVIVIGFSNLSNSALDTAVQSAINAGITVVSPAGNNNADACLYSPGRVSAGITVGALQTGLDGGGIDELQRANTYSNYGPCVTLFAPGSLIQGAWKDSDTSTTTRSSTLNSAGLVAGVIAQYLSFNPTATPAQVKTWLLNEAKVDQINMQCSGSPCTLSPNKRLYKDSSTY